MAAARVAVTPSTNAPEVPQGQAFGRLMCLEAATRSLPDEDSTRPARLRDLRLARWATINLVGSYSRLILGRTNADIAPDHKPFHPPLGRAGMHVGAR